MSDKVHLPGSKAKQADALSRNIRWLGQKFGIERIGFLTLTCGDEVDGHFVKVDSRAEASRRFNSLLNRIRKRYQCGVVVTERHKDGGIHFHLVVVVGADIRSGVDFDACFPPRENGKYKWAPCYDTAPARLKLEWKFWRERAEGFGFGRCQLQPAKENAEALGFYVGKYISKSWEARCDDDKGGRLVRYFGNWREAGEDTNPRTGKPFRFAPPHSARHGGLSGKAIAWRDCMKQIRLSLGLQGLNLTEWNVKGVAGRRWAYAMTRRIRENRFFVRGSQRLREAMETHNAEVGEEWPSEARHIGYTTAEHWLPQPDWEADNIANERGRLDEQRHWEKIDGLRESLPVGHGTSNGATSSGHVPGGVPRG